MKSESFFSILFIEFNLHMHIFLAAKQLYRPVGLLVGPFVCLSFPNKLWDSFELANLKQVRQQIKEHFKHC